MTKIAHPTKITLKRKMKKVVNKQLKARRDDRTKYAKKRHGKSPSITALNPTTNVTPTTASKPCKIP